MRTAWSRYIPVSEAGGSAKAVRDGGVGVLATREPDAG